MSSITGVVLGGESGLTKRVVLAKFIGKELQQSSGSMTGCSTITPSLTLLTAHIKRMYKPPLSAKVMGLTSRSVTRFRRVAGRGLSLSLYTGTVNYLTYLITDSDSMPIFAEDLIWKVGEKQEWNETEGDWVNIKTYRGIAYDIASAHKDNDLFTQYLENHKLKILVRARKRKR